MTSTIRRFFAATAAGAMITTLGFAAASPAGASAHYKAFSVSGTTKDHNGESGYYVNDSGGWRIKDAHASVTVRSVMKDLNGTQAGAVGIELCDPDTSIAAQLGLIWDPTAQLFEVHYDFGTPSGPGTGNDPCIDNGLISQDPSTTPRLLDGVHIRLGDVLTFDVYYDPSAETLQFTASDVTQNVTRQATLPSFEVGAQSFYEAGIGVLSSNTPALTPPVTNPVAVFTGTSFNSYGATTRHFSVLGGWDTKEAETLNGGSQVILSPNSSLNGAGSAFTVFEGGIV